jgi:hypothetical protein
MNCLKVVIQDKTRATLAEVRLHPAAVLVSTSQDHYHALTAVSARQA